jgi:hypothetical protein
MLRKETRITGALSNVATCGAPSSPFGHDYISLYKRRFVMCGYSISENDIEHFSHSRDEVIIMTKVFIDIGLIDCTARPTSRN